MSARDIIESALREFAWDVDDGWDVKECTQAVIEALAAAGYKIVSREVENEVTQAGQEACGYCMDSREVWRAMFDASNPTEKQT